MVEDRPLEPIPRAIIVGASSGIGAALARRLARESFALGLLARRLDLLEALQTELDPDASGSVHVYQHDVLQTELVPELLQTVARDLGGLDLFIYNSGIMFPADAAVYDVEQDLKTLAVNLAGAMAWLNPAAQRFERAGGGHLVAIGSIAGDRGRRAILSYSASKAGLHTYMEGLRNRVSRSGVHVTTIKPGQIQTEMLKNAARVQGPIPAEDAAGLIWKAIRRKKQTAYVPGRWRLIALVIRNIPSFIFRRMNF